VLAGVLGVLPGEGDEQPAAALTTTHPATTATRGPDYQGSVFGFL
jgi:hypothetical protein